MVGRAVATVNKATKAFCKFTSANDAGSTGAHQAGYYMPKNAWSIMFDHPGLKGENKDEKSSIHKKGFRDNINQQIRPGIQHPQIIVEKNMVKNHKIFYNS